MKDKKTDKKEYKKELIYKLNCIECGYIWQCRSADWSECPMCQSKDIVVIESIDISQDLCINKERLHKGIK